MAQGILFICNSCGYEIETWDEGNPYYIDESGQKQYAYYPDKRREGCVGVRGWMRDGSAPWGGYSVLARPHHPRISVQNKLPIPQPSLGMDNKILLGAVCFPADRLSLTVKSLGLTAADPRIALKDISPKYGH